jgi:tyrosyl-tRNA synthetase
MSLADNMIIQYFDLLTDVPEEELAEFSRELVGGKINPMNLKKRLACELVAQLHSQSAATQADEHFTRVFQKKELPDEAQEVCVNTGEDLRDTLVKAGVVKSKSEVSRLIQQGAVSIDGTKMESATVDYKNGNIIKIGKHRFIKVVIVK